MLPILSRYSHVWCSYSYRLRIILTRNLCVKKITYFKTSVKPGWQQQQHQSHHFKNRVFTAFYLFVCPFTTIGVAKCPIILCLYYNSCFNIVYVVASLTRHSKTRSSDTMRKCLYIQLCDIFFTGNSQIIFCHNNNTDVTMHSSHNYYCTVLSAHLYSSSLS